MKTNAVMDIVSDHLQEVNSNQKERVKRIKKLLTFLTYNLRLTELSEEEKEDFVYCQEGYPLTDDQKRILDMHKGDKKTYDHYIDMWARSTYFRQVAWERYLFGESEEKPPMTSEKDEKKVA